MGKKKHKPEVKPYWWRQALSHGHCYEIASPRYVQRDSDTMIRILRTSGPWRNFRANPPGGISNIKRPKRPNNYYRELATTVWNEVIGDSLTYYSWNPAGKLPYKIELLLDRLYLFAESPKELSHYARLEYIFLKAIAKDLRVWPAPKWWRVRRRMQAGNRFTTQYTNQK